MKFPPYVPRSGFRQKAASIGGGLPTAATPASAESGFTMVEIALCLAIIGFALVAIIGVLPTGLNVQRDNRQETIIDQDAAVWMDAIRNGAQGYNDLTNYVIAITNYVWHYTWDPGTGLYKLDDVGLTGTGSPEINVFTRTAWYRNGALQTSDPQFQLTNGEHIIGVLSRPEIEWNGPPANPYASFYRNFIVANIRAMSGSAVEKFPQTNTVILDSAFSYRLIPEIVSYVPFDTNLIRAVVVSGVPYDPSIVPASLQGVENPFDPALPGIDTNNTPPFASGSTPWTAAQRQAYWDQVRVNRRVIGAAYTNAHDLRLTFRWPLLPNGDAGIGRHTFRLFTGGQLFQTNDPSPGVLKLPLYFLQPSTYVQAQ